jgi:hypothetical protein
MFTKLWHVKSTKVSPEKNVNDLNKTEKQPETPQVLEHSVINSTSKLILENRSDLPMIDFLKMAEYVLKSGRLSNDGKQYCYLTSFKEYHIVSELNKKSDKLIMYKASR